MMKKTLLLTIMLLSAVFIGTAWGQSTLTVCDGDETNDYVPVYNYYADTDGTTSEFIIPYNDTEGMSTMKDMAITAISFYIYSTDDPNEALYYVYMKDDIQETSISSVLGPDACTIVYSGALDCSGETLNITFDIPFVYGGGNLLIGTYVYSKGKYKDCRFIGVNADNASCCYYSNNTTVQNFLPKTTFTYETPASCPKPIGISVSNITSSSATISWTESGTATEWILQVGTDAEFESGTYNEINVETNPSKNVSLTQQGMVYYARVMSSCGGEDYSKWSSICEFKTSYTKDLDYNYGFEDAEELDYWSLVYCDDDTKITNYQPYDGDYCFEFYSNDNPLPQYLISPEFDGIDNIKVEFYYNSADDGFPESFQVGYSSTGVELSAFTWGEIITDNDPSSWDKFEDIYPAGAKYIAIRYITNNSYFLFLDNMSFEAVTDVCLKPTDVVVSDITTESAYISWSSDANNFNIQYRKSPDGEWYTKSSENTNITLDDLDSGTIYDVQVQANCGYNVSNWTKIKTFNTAICDDADKCNISYSLTDSYGDGWTGNAIKILDNSTNIELATLTIANGSSASGTVAVCDQSEIVFNWVRGGDGAECGFTITGPTGDVIITHDPGSAPAAGELKVYQLYCSPTFIKNGDWNDGDNWSNGTIPSSTEDVSINVTCTIPASFTAEVNSVTVEDGGILIIEDTGKLDGNLIINDGGQLIASNSIPATVNKTITNANSKDADEHWYTISTPVHKDATDNVVIGETNLTTMGYDMFYFDEAQGKWINQKTSGTGFSNMYVGKGYLYRNDGTDLVITGNTNYGNIDYTLTKDGSGDIAGFNLIGNPYPHDINLKHITYSKGENLNGCYILSDAGAWGSELDGDATISSYQGFLVQADVDDKVATFHETAQRGAKSNGDNIKFMVANSQYEDVAYALFDKGFGLSKINHRNAAIPMLYINQEDADYAIATMSDDTKSFNLNFKAMTTGKYTLSYKADGNFSYLHVIDRLTGEDVDMLLEGEYSFIASPIDSENRFIVRLEYSAGSEISESSIFAYQSGSDIIVNGEGELQIFDVMGRRISTQYVSGVETINLQSHGVFIFRLNEKTQKIVVK